MNTYRITCRETVYFVKEVKANSEDAKELGAPSDPLAALFLILIVDAIA